MEDMLQVGVITSPHGVHGEVKVYPTTDDVKRFKKLKTVTLDSRKGPVEAHVKSVKFFKNMVILGFEEYETIDYNFYNIIKQLEEALKNKDKILVESFDFNFVIKNSNETDVELIENGNEINVTLDNLENFLTLAKSKRTNEMIPQIEYIKNGLYSAIKKNIIQILNWKQIEEMVCGKDKLDIKDLKHHTKYNGYKSKEAIIKWFWEWLENSSEENQFKYLKFVSGRTRLPKSIFGLNYKHNITKVSIENKLPRAATCFFTLKLPNYDSKEVFIEKMNFAIENSYEINDDH